MGLFGKRKNEPETKAIEREAYVGATVTPSDAVTTKFARNLTSYELMQRAQGLPAILANLNAQACANQTLRLYRVRSARRGGRGGIAPATRKAMANGRMGRRAVEADSRGDIIEVPVHPALELLRDPARGVVPIGGYQWLVHLFWFLEITGEAYRAVIETEDGIALAPLASHWVKIIPSETEFISGYAYGRDRGDVRMFEPGDVHYFRYYEHPDDPFRGLGSLEPVIRAADVLLAEDVYQKERIESGNVPASLFSVSPDANSSSKQLESFKQQFESKLRAFGSRVRSIFTDLPVNVTPLPQTAEQMQASEELGRQRLQILNSFGVPESMVELNSANLASSRSGYEVQYLDATVRPRINVVADQLTAHLMPLFGIDPAEYFFAFDDPVPQNLETHASTFVSLVASGVLTPNEARQELGFERIRNNAADDLQLGGGGFGFGGSGAVEASEAGTEDRRPSDQLGFGPSRMDTRSAPAQTREDIRVVEHSGSGETTGDGEGKRVDDHGHANSARVDSANSVRSAIDAVDRWSGSCPACGLADGSKAVDPLFTGIDDLGQLLASMQSVVQRFLQRDLVEKLDELERIGLSPSAIDTLPGADLDALARELEPTFARMFGEGMIAGAREVGAGDDLPDDPLTLVNENAREAMEENLLGLARDLEQTTRDQIAAAVDRGFAEGLGISEIREEIERAGVASESRAEMIARTETQQAANAGKMRQSKDLGFSLKVWQNAPGATAVHQELTRMFSNGVPIDKPFLKAGTTVRGRDGTSETFRRDIFHPPARPNCRCSFRAKEADI